jgi:hypothetical protein
MNSKPPVPETPLTPFIPLTLMMEHGAALNCDKIKTVCWIFTHIHSLCDGMHELTVHFRFFNTNTCIPKSTRELCVIISTGAGRRGYGRNRISTRRHESSNPSRSPFVTPFTNCSRDDLIQVGIRLGRKGSHGIRTFLLDRLLVSFHVWPCGSVSNEIGWLCLKCRRPLTSDLTTYTYSCRTSLSCNTNSSV